jgi:hypothetical protein
MYCMSDLAPTVTYLSQLSLIIIVLERQGGRCIIHILRLAQAILGISSWLEVAAAYSPL